LRALLFLSLLKRSTLPDCRPALRRASMRNGL